MIARPYGHATGTPEVVCPPAWFTQPWSYFPRNVRPPSWAVSFVEVVKAAEAKISTVEHKTGLSSNDVLKELGPGLS